MATRNISTRHLDYLQRVGIEPGPLPDPSSISKVPLTGRRLWRISGIGRRDGEESNPFSSGRASFRPEDPVFDPGRENMLSGLHAYGLPISFLVWGEPGGAAVHLGTWVTETAEAASAEGLDATQGIIRSVLGSFYDRVDAEQMDVRYMASPPMTGLAMGVPTAAPSTEKDLVVPLDRVIRAMTGMNWAFLVLAEPLDEGEVTALRHDVINEIRAVESAADAERAPSPLAKHYTELLGRILDPMTQALAVGAWRTTVYLAGDEISYPRLVSVWRSVYSSKYSLPEPVRIWNTPGSAALFVNWSVPDIAAPKGPGNFSYPYQYQTVLSSNQLSNYIHLPQQETSGYSVTLMPEFDIVPPKMDHKRGIALGRVIERHNRTELDYLISDKVLNRHGLVAGATGSGKTNTIQHLLMQLWSREIPFLVLEPAKVEYRSLLNREEIGADLRVFTMGQEQVSPFRLNPFEVEPGVSLATHIDLLKSVFNASFGMWSPLPQVMERCIHAVYRDFGWDSVRGENRRLNGSSDMSQRGDAFPTLSDLYQKVEEIVDSLGYEARVTSDIKAALMTRLNGLRIGGKGVLLDTNRSIPVKEILERPTIIELEQIGDDDEKAFVMGLILIKVYEHLRARGASAETALRHVVVVEEAHRLLANVAPQSNVEFANARGKAVETFVNMLSEVRAYGEGFLIAEQIPGKLSPDVIKNTNLKIVHRIVAGDDRALLSETMNMDQRQSRSLATLQTDNGEAVVFMEGDDRPLLITVPYVKTKTPPEMRSRTSSDQLVKEHMQEIRAESGFATFLNPPPTCIDASGEAYRTCAESKRLLGYRDVRLRIAAMMLALSEDAELAVPAYNRFLSFARSRLNTRPEPEQMSCLLLHGLEWYLKHFGRCYAWPFDLVNEMREAAMPVLTAITGEQTDMAGLERSVSAFGSLIKAGGPRTSPFSACPMICPDDTCKYRYHAAMYLNDPGLDQLFTGALTEAGLEGEWLDWTASDEVADRLLADGPYEAQRSIELCYGVQNIATMPDFTDQAKSAAIWEMIRAYDCRHETVVGEGVNQDCSHVRIR